MSDAQKPALDTASAETVLAQLAAKAEKQAKKAKKASKKAKKIGKAMKEVLKSHGIDPEDDRLGGTPPAVIEVLTRMGAVKDKFTEKSAKKAQKQADYDKAVTMVRKAFKIEAPKPPLPAAPREIVFAIDMGGRTLRQVLPFIDAAYKTAGDDVVTAGRKATPHVAHFSNGTWVQLNVSHLPYEAVDAEYKKTLHDALALPMFKAAGFDTLARQIAPANSRAKTKPAAQHYVLVLNHAAESSAALQAALETNTSCTIDIIATKDGNAAALASLRQAFPRRVALHTAPTTAAVAATLSLVTNARLDQRLDALNAKPAHKPKSLAPLS